MSLLSRIPPGLWHMISAAFFFSILSLFVKAAGKLMPSTELVFARGVMGVVFSWVMIKHARIYPWGNRKGLLLLRGGLGTVALLCFYYSVTHLPLAEATVIQLTNPVFTALFAGFFLDERIRRAEVGAAVVCLIGVGLVTRPAVIFGEASAGFDPLTIAAALAGAVLSGLAYVTVRKLGESEHHLVTVLYFPLVTTPMVFPLALPTMTWPTGTGWLLLLGMGVSMQLAQVQMTRSLKLERAGRAMSMIYVQLVFAVLWGLIFFGERPDGLSIVGMVVIVICTLWVGQNKPKPRQEGEEMVSQSP